MAWYDQSSFEMDFRYAAAKHLPLPPLDGANFTQTNKLR